MILRLHRLAVAEIDHEVDYYEAKQPGLGAELEDEVDSVLAMILRFPHAAPQWKTRVDRRVAVLDRLLAASWNRGFPDRVPRDGPRDPRNPGPGSGLIRRPS